MHTGLLHLHNLLRYAIVILIILSVVKSYIGWFSKKEYTATDNKLSLFLFISAHLQLVVGLGVYFMSPIYKALKAAEDKTEMLSNPEIMFFMAEHMMSMILGIIIITLGRIMGKKGKTDSIKFRRQAIYFTLAMVIIFSAIPWPWSAIARPLF